MTLICMFTRYTNSQQPSCARSINNALPFKSVALAQSYSIMSFAILTKICINDTQKKVY